MPERDKILIIDDEEFVLASLRRVLSSNRCEIVTVTGGTEALKLINADDFAVIICDQNMPDMKGQDVLSQAALIKPDTIRIMLTADSDVSVAINSINVGHVHNFILKPWDNKLLKQLVHDAVDRYKLVLENKRLHKLTQDQYNQIQKDLVIGSKIQEELLFGDIPQSLKGLSVHVDTTPSKMINGDFFDFVVYNDTIIDVLVGDVMGKGIPAALVGASLKSQFSRFAKSNFYGISIPIDDTDARWPEIADILGNMEAEISIKLQDLEIFSTLFLCRIDIFEHTLTYVDCGSTKPIHYRCKQKETAVLEGENFPLGMVTQDRFVEKCASVDHNDLIIFYSDGVTEARSSDGECFGVDRLRELVGKHHTLSPGELSSKIKFSVEEFAGGCYSQDDFTLVIVRME